MAVVDQLSVVLSLDADKFSVGIKKAEAATDLLSKNITSAIKTNGDAFITHAATAAKWGAAVVAAAGAASAAIVASGFATAKSLQNTADQLNINVESFRALADSANDFGIDQGKLTQSLSVFNAQVAQAVSGNDALAQQFLDVGLNAQKLEGMGLDERMLAVADAVNSAATYSEKLNIAMTALGSKAGKSFVAFLDQGSESLKSATDEFKAFHGAINAVTFAKINQGQVALDDLGDSIESAKLAFTAGMAPAIKMIVDLINSSIAAAGGFGSVVTAITDVTKAMAKMVGDMAMGFSIMKNEVVAFALSFAVGAMKIYRSASDLGQKIWNVVSEPVKLLSTLWNRVVESIASAASKLVGTFAQIAISAGDITFGKNLQELSGHLQNVELDAKATADAISFKSVDTTAITAAINLTQDMAAASSAAAMALEEQARAGESWGNLAVAKIQEVSVAMDAAAAAKVAKDEANRANEQTTMFDHYAILGQQAMDYYTYIAGLSQANYDKRLAQIYQQQADAQANLDFETTLATDADAAKLVRETELNTEVNRLRAEQMQQDRQAGQANLALWTANYQGKMDVAANFLGQMSQLMQSENKKMFEVGKAAAIAETVINTYKAATGAYSAMAAIPVVGPALGAAAAGAAVVAGMANVKRIQSTKMGGGGVAGGSGQGVGATAGGGAGVGGVPTASQGAAPETTINRTYNIQLSGDNYSAQQVRGLIGAINQSVGDGTKLRVA